MNPIGVQSYAELYTLLVGWSLYGKIWTLLTQSGIAFIPLIGLVIRNFAKPYESQDAKDAASTSLRRMEIDLLVVIFLILLGAAPCIPLTPSMVAYTPLCQRDGQSTTYHPGDTGTTWDKAFAIPSEEISVPIWWYVVLSISEGVTASANTMVGCVPNLRSMVTQVDMAQITDPQLKQELQDFEEDCFLPAREHYLHDIDVNADPNAINTIKNDLTTYGSDDTEWFGSHGLQDAYYRNQSAKHEVPGFPYDASQDINAENDQDSPPAYGTPDCYSWWNDANSGLKTRLLSVMPPTFWDKVKNYFSDDNTLQDDILKKLVAKKDASIAPAVNNDNPYDYSQGVAGLGAWLSQFETYPKLYAAAEAAPIIQALLLMLVYAFLPLALVFSSYRPRSFITGSMMIFSLIFWSFIWHLVSYADNALMQAFYGNSWFSQHTPSASLGDMIIGTLIIVAPLFWFSFMGAMGVAVGDFVSSATSSLNNPATTSAEKGFSATKSAVRTVNSVAKIV